MAKKIGIVYLIALKEFKDKRQRIFTKKVYDNSIYGLSPDVFFEAGASIAFRQAITM